MLSDAGRQARYLTHASAVFESVVRSDPGRPALRWAEQEHTTFGELDRRANQIARLLVARGVHKRDIVCLCLEKTPLAYAAIVACLKIGAPYVMVDPVNPAARTRAMMARCRPALAIVDVDMAAASARDERFGCELLAVGVDGELPELDAHSADAFACPWTIEGSDPAYVMFTSGSTGTPKGAVISHANLLNFIAWSRSQFDVQPDDIFTNLNPLFFDNSVFDLYASLFNGASLVPFTAAMLKAPAAAVARIGALGCTMFFSVPSLLVYFQALKLIDATSFAGLRAIVFGGEGYPKPMLAKLFSQLGARIGLYNVYGPTECTCICSVYRISDADFSSLTGYAPLGQLIANFSHAVIGEAGQAVPDGVTGELFLGGPCVGLGYLDEPELTAAAFVQNPTQQRFSERMYRTGDLVRRDPIDGKLWFMGRADSQIKHQGYRIELGEIEHALTSMAGVDEAAAVYVTHGGQNRIVGVVASRQKLMPPDVKAHVRAFVPHYMVPDRVVVVAELLKNANGKIDRRAVRAAVERGDLG